MQSYFYNKQQGATLLVSLVLLLTLTTIALSSMNNTLLDEKVVGNYRDKSLSKLMADTVLREPEVWLQGRLKRLELEDKLCEDNTRRCTTSALWKSNSLNWSSMAAVDGWWGEPSRLTWGDGNELPLAYGVNGSNAYCSGKSNQTLYNTKPLFVDDGNDHNNCLANIIIPPTYIVEESSMESGSLEIRSLETSTGMLSTCSSKINVTIQHKFKKN